jgi:DNA-binding NtrC family response regulator
MGISLFRILIVEDDPDRLRIIQSWMPQDVIVSNVTDAGAAMGQIRRDRGRVYAGIMLDHDLQEQLKVASSKHLCGNDVVNVIIGNIDKSVPILVHSMNPFQAGVMVRRLESSGFDVTRIPMAELTDKKLFEWVEDARELWEELQE